jgi:acyl-CoA synthetase (AMP-forming)/AMP-acid ligase II
MHEDDGSAAVSGTFETIDRLMCAAAEQFPDRDAYVEDGGRISFAQWHWFSDALAVELRARGVGRGDVVALMLPSSIDYAVCFG